MAETLNLKWKLHRRWKRKVQSENIAMGEDDSMTSSEPTMEENQQTEEVQSSENETVTTETTTETPQENTSATSQTETDTQSDEVSQEDTSQESETVSEESSMDENTPSENTPTQEGGDEVNVADTETDGEVSDTPTVSVEVQEIGDKVAKIIAKVNQNLKRVSDRVRLHN